MATLKGSETHENLKRAFATEAEANRRYVYFARQADIEGYRRLQGSFVTRRRARPATPTGTEWATRCPGRARWAAQ